MFFNDFKKHPGKKAPKPIRLQITDVGFAFNAKVAAEACKRQLRSAQRTKAQREGVTAQMESSAYEMMKIAIAMHKDCVERNEKEAKVLKTARACGWLAYEAGEKGLVPATGEKWKDFPLGSSRLGDDWLTNRYAHLDENGRTTRPD